MALGPDGRNLIQELFDIDLTAIRMISRRRGTVRRSANEVSFCAYKATGWLEMN